MGFLSLDGTALIVLEKRTLTPHTRRIKDMKIGLEHPVTAKCSWLSGQPAPSVNTSEPMFADHLLCARLCGRDCGGYWSKTVIGGKRFKTSFATVNPESETPWMQASAAVDGNHIRAKENCLVPKKEGEWERWKLKEERVMGKDDGVWMGLLGRTWEERMQKDRFWSWMLHDIRCDFLLCSSQNPQETLLSLQILYLRVNFFFWVGKASSDEPNRGLNFLLIWTWGKV